MTASAWKKRLLLLLRAASTVSVLAGGLMLADLFLPAGASDTAEVTGVETAPGRAGGTEYYLRARGRHTYNENIASELAAELRPGDILDIRLTPFMAEMKSVSVSRNGKVIMQMTGRDLLPMGIFGVLFLLTAFAWLPAGRLAAKPGLAAGLVLLSLLGVLIGGRFLLAAVGVIDKM